MKSKNDKRTRDKRAAEVARLKRLYLIEARALALGLVQ